MESSHQCRRISAPVFININGFFFHYQSPLFLGARFLVTNSRSCSLRPNSSSFATRARSLSIPFKACSTAAYMPIATEGEPFSMAHKVARLMLARSATSSVDSFLRSLASFICSPICARIFSVCGIITVVLLLMFLPSFYFCYYKQKY